MCASVKRKETWARNKSNDDDNDDGIDNHDGEQTT